MRAKVLFLFLLSIQLFGCNSKTSHDSSTRSVESDTIIDHNLPLVSTSEIDTLDGTSTWSISHIHGKYMPYIDSIIAIGHNNDSLNLWMEVDSVPLEALPDSLYWQLLAIHSKGQYSRIDLHFIDSSKIREYHSFYLVGGSLSVLKTKMIVEFADIIEDKSVLEVADFSVENERYEEVSCFEKDQIVYQNSFDCGAPNSEEYISHVETEALQRVSIIHTILDL